jgi:hypothetical protein
MRDPELVARAERAARRLESAWEKWRTQHGLAVAPGQPIVSYVGYSLTEPWGEPRVVIGIDADEAEYLADFLDRDDGAQQVQVPRQQATLAGSPVALAGSPVALAGSPVALAGSPVAPAAMAGAQEGSGEYTGAALVGAPVSVGIGLQSQPQPHPHPQPHPQPQPQSQPQDQVRDVTTELPAWSPGELADQATEQVAGWPGGPAATDQPPATA